MHATAATPIAPGRGLAMGLGALAALAMNACPVAGAQAVPATEAAPRGMVLVPAGTYRPFYAPSEKERAVVRPAFLLDRLPVTNGDFLAFVRARPTWQRGRVSRLFAEAGYLSHWVSPVELGPLAGPDQPVTRVSWFAAKAYCEWRGARLPLEAEWEYAAAASDTAPDGRDDDAWRDRILEWYARPAQGTLARAGAGRPNFFGVHDLHGLTWEWVLDFNSTLVSEDSRGGAREADRLRFCGVGAVGSRDARDYASFMRIAFRSALLPQYTTSALGFRCAASAPAAGVDGGRP